MNAGSTLRAHGAYPRKLSRRLAVGFALLLAALMMVLVSGCGGQSSSSSETSTRITVFASAVLTEAFTKLGDDFSAAHPDIEVVLNFSGAGELVAQMRQGAPVDVLATADTSFMDEAGDLVSTPRIFAGNTLAIAVPPGNPEHIVGLADLSRSDLKVVLGSEETSIGRYSAEILERAGVSVAPVSLEVTVKGVVTKIALGEADAGVVFVTDVIAADGDIDSVTIPASQNLIAGYPIATVVASESPENAQAFVDLVMSSQGQQVLLSFGFLPPSAP